ncbi:MAG: hypothetical protein JWM11_8055 [Planctomycetaceae bacterium]|nr:hypothetical protein [Planctomycetaceae bacterium]
MLKSGLRIIAIAYEWRSVPTFVAGCDVILSLSRVERFIGEDPLVDSEGVCKSDTVESVAYKLEFPERIPSDGQLDVSGTLGLFGKGESRSSEIFERYLADAVLWEIAAIEWSHPVRSALFILGPIIPKLRGRLYYRYLDPKLSVVGVTHSPEWISRMIGSVDRSASSTSKEIRWEGPLPALSLDAGSRTFAGIWDGVARCAIEIITNTWDPLNYKEWWSEKEEMLHRVWQSGSGAGGLVSQTAIPAPMIEAQRSASEMLTRIYSFEVGCRNALWLIERLCGPRSNKIDQFSDKSWLQNKRHVNKLLKNVFSVPVNICGLKLVRDFSLEVFQEKVAAALDGDDSRDVADAIKSLSEMSR